MNIFERRVGSRRYRIASQSLWDPTKQRPFAQQAVLGPAAPAPVADLALTRTIGTRLFGDMGALVWVAEQLDLIKLIDQSCGLKAPRGGPTVGEMVLAVAVQRACAAAGKCHFAAFCRWRGKRVPKWRRSGPLPREPFGVSLSLFSEVLSGTARSRQGRAVVGRGEANP